MVSSFNLQDVVEQLTWMNTCKAGAFLLAAHMLHIGLLAYTSPRSLCKSAGLRFDGQPFATTSSNKRSDTTDSDAPETKPNSSGAAKGRVEDSQTENFWPLLFASREVGLGLVLLVLGGLGEWRAVGVVVGMVAAILATTDGAAHGMYGRGGWAEAVTSHGVPGVVLGVVAVVLLRG